MNLSQRINILAVAALPIGIWGMLGLLGIIKRTVFGPQLDSVTFVFTSLLTILFLGVALVMVHVGAKVQAKWREQDGKRDQR